MKDEHFKMIQVYQFNMPQYLVKLGTKKKKRKLLYILAIPQNC